MEDNKRCTSERHIVQQTMYTYQTQTYMYIRKLQIKTILVNLKYAVHLLSLEHEENQWQFGF